MWTIDEQIEPTNEHKLAESSNTIGQYWIIQAALMSMFAVWLHVVYLLSSPRLTE